jgi:hypothetical protein
MCTKTNQRGKRIYQSVRNLYVLSYYIDDGSDTMVKNKAKGVFSVTRICSRTLNWPACVKFHATDHTKFRVSVFYGLRDGIGNG